MTERDGTLEEGKDIFVHPSALVDAEEIGSGTRIWQFVVILAGAVIGRETNICSHVFVESDVRVGARVTIKAGVQLWNGITIEDDVFVGPNVSFTNDRHPRSGNRDFALGRIVLRRGCSIGAGACILPDIEIGEGAMVGAGAVVTKNVAPNTTVVGNPARPL